MAFYWCKWGKRESNFFDSGETKANITIAVKEPKTTGNKIVKSYRFEPPPKIEYVEAADK